MNVVDALNKTCDAGDRLVLFWGSYPKPPKRRCFSGLGIGGELTLCLAFGGSQVGYNEKDKAQPPAAVKGFCQEKLCGPFSHLLDGFALKVTTLVVRLANNICIRLLRSLAGSKVLRTFLLLFWMCTQKVHFQFFERVSLCSSRCQVRGKDAMDTLEERVRIYSELLGINPMVRMVRIVEYQ